MEKKKVVIILSILFLAIFSRLIFLNFRPLHMDEGVNYFFADNIISGRGWEYDPLNYHGPFHFFMIALSFLIFGISGFSLRFPAALSGIILVVIPLFLKFKESQKIKISILLLVATSLFFYSRYSIHETSFILFCFLSFYFMNRIIEEKSLKGLPFLALFLALAFTTKETSILFLVVLLLMTVFNFKSLKEINFGKERSKIFLSIFIFVFLWVLLFSSFFSSLVGLRNSVEAFMPWTKTGVEGMGHEKPFYYFVLLMVKYELPLVLLSISAIYFYFREKEKNILFKNSIIWFVSALLVYSLIPYKTPWLVMNITLPAIVLSSFALERIKFKNFVFVLSIIYLISFLFYLNFIIPYQQENLFAYGHTDKDILNLINSLNSQASSDSKILVDAESYWPLPFYLDRYTVYYQNTPFEKSNLDFFDFAIVQEGLYNNTENLTVYTLKQGVRMVLVTNH